MSANLIAAQTHDHDDVSEVGFLGHWKHNWQVTRLKQDREAVYEKLDKWFSIRQEQMIYLLGEMASAPNADLVKIKTEIAILEKHWSNVGHVMPVIKGDEHQHWYAKTVSDLENKYKVAR